MGSCCHDMDSRRHHVGGGAISKILECPFQGHEGKPVSGTDLDMAFDKHHQADCLGNRCLSDNHVCAWWKSAAMLWASCPNRLGCKFPVLGCSAFLKSIEHFPSRLGIVGMMLISRFVGKNGKKVFRKLWN